MSPSSRFHVLLLLWFAHPVVAKDLSGLYDEATLQGWQPRFERSTKQIYELGILNRHLNPRWHDGPVLTEGERRALANVRFEFPVHGDGPYKGDPLAFYTRPRARDSERPATVVMPIFSILFLNDLSIAHAWLQVNGFSLATASEYVAMLKYRNAKEFLGGRYPPPLRALHIPDDALRDPKVSALSLRLFNSARAFILLHELGHVYSGDRPRQDQDEAEMRRSRQQEEAADRFAVNVLRRTMEEPVGAGLYFMAAVHWVSNQADFRDGQDWVDYLERKATHPLTSDRLHHLAEGIGRGANDFARDEPDVALGQERVKAIAFEIDEIAQILETPGLLHTITITALATDDESLLPRRPGELIARPAPDANATRRPLPTFEGLYSGTYTRAVAGEEEKLSIGALFRRNGNRVEGRFSIGLGQGTITQGTLAGNRLTFDWQWAGKYGKGQFNASEDGTAFSGTWGYRESRDNGGTWSGRREE